MARTTTTAVREILSTNLEEPQLKAFVDDAHLWVGEELGSSRLSGERLELIERYLACALTRARELGLKSVSIGDVSESYQNNAEVSDYLLRAAGFDPTGKVRSAFLTPANVRIIPVVSRVGQGFSS